MSHHHFRRNSVLIAAAAALGLAGTPVAAQMLSGAPTRAVQTGPAVAAAPVDSHPACRVVAGQDRFDYPLLRVSRHLDTDRSIKIVAIGSSSTAGAGASSPDATYPSRLEVELTRHFLWHDIAVVNRGANGEEAADMLARFDTSVVAEQPDLVIWQTGTNSVLRDRPLDPKATVLHQGLARLKAIHTDVI